MLLSGVRNKIDAFIAWGWDYFSKNRATAMVSAPEAGRIDWGDDDEGEKPEFDPAPTQSAFTRTG
jgi:NADH dehydrogenase